MQGRWIIHSAWYAMLPEFRGDSVTAGQFHRVLRPDTGITGGHLRHLNAVRKRAGIIIRNAIASVDLGREDTQFFEQNRRLHGVDSTIDTDPDIVIFICTFAVYAQATQHLGETIVIGKNGTAVSITTERLGGKKLVDVEWANVPTPRPLRVAPKLCAASAMTTMRQRSATSLSVS